MNELVVARAGMLTTVQDAGRAKHRNAGIALCGALDAVALTVANMLAGNANDAAALEITMGNAAFTFTTDTRFALTGADTAASLDGEPVPPWSSGFARAGQTLELRVPEREMRTVLAVAGGFDVPLVLGSRSTDLQAAFGGYHGRALAAGDRIPIGTPRHSFGRERFRVKPPQWEFDAGTVGVLRAPEYDSFDAASHEALWEHDWIVTSQSNRMGCRLKGDALQYNASTMEVLSHAVFPGVIQVPPSGQPIVLLSDAQTTGGYPKIGVVRQADLWKLANVPLGGTVRLRKSTRAQAEEARRNLERFLDEIDAAVASRRVK